MYTSYFDHIQYVLIHVYTYWLLKLCMCSIIFMHQTSVYYVCKKNNEIIFKNVHACFLTSICIFNGYVLYIKLIVCRFAHVHIMIATGIISSHKKYFSVLCIYFWYIYYLFIVKWSKYKIISLRSRSTASYTSKDNPARPSGQLHT